MANISYTSGKAQAKQELTQFKTATATLKTAWNGFSASDKNNALTNLSTGWAGATALQRAEALRVAVCLLYVVVGYLVYKVIEQEN